MKNAMSVFVGLFLFFVALPIAMCGGCLALGVGTATTVATLPEVEKVRKAKLVNELKAAEKAQPPATPVAKPDPAPEPKPDHQPRTWTATTGQTTEATYVGREGESVRLRKPDGTEVVVPIGRLIQSDQSLVQEYGKAP